MFRTTFSTMLKNALFDDRRSNLNNLPAIQSMIRHYSVEKTAISFQMIKIQVLT